MGSSKEIWVYEPTLGWLPALGDVTGALVVVAPALAIILPLAKATLVLNSALPAAEAPWLGADILPTNSPSCLRLYVSVSVGGVFRIARTAGGVTVIENLNSGNPLNANSAYTLDIEWRAGDSLNFRYSVTAGFILCFRADEIGAAA